MKDYLRDYATAAFRFYAKNFKSAEKFKNKIREEAIQAIEEREGKAGISKPTEAAIMRAEKAVEEKIAEIMDMEAVEKVIAELKCKRDYEIIQAIEEVYFINPEEELNLGDIQNRVKIASLKIPASESSVYRWLKKSRQSFSEKRGLRIKS